MVHSGYEASAVDHTFSGIGGLWATVKSMLAGTYEDAEALNMLNEPSKPVHSYNPLIQIKANEVAAGARMEETHA
jgi:hypothetical protein